MASVSERINENLLYPNRTGSTEKLREFFTREFAGTGSPEGVRTAPPGSRYTRVDVGEAYIKATGTGSTGWVVIAGTSSSSGTVNILDYGAVGDGVTNSVLSIQAAIDAVYAAGGGTVLIPAGQFRCESALDRKPGVSLVGVGTKRSRLDFPIDLGVGTFAIRTVTPAGDYGDVGTIENLWVSGPATFAVGVQGANMDGIRVESGMDLTNVRVTRFRGGFVMAQNHNTLIRCIGMQNHYNVLMPTAPASGDNHNFIGCILHQPSLASFAVEGSGFCSQATFVGCQFGYGPYCLYRFGSGGSIFLNNTIFDNCSFEATGNSYVCDVGATPGTFYGVQFRRCYGTLVGVTYRSGAHSSAYAFDVGSAQFVIDYGTLANAVPPGGTRVFNFTSTFFGLTVEGATLPASASSLLQNGGLGAVFKGQQGSTTAQVFEARGWYASGTITKGDLLAWSALGNRVARYTAGAQLAGVAMVDATDGQTVLVAMPNSMVDINGVTGTVAGPIRSDVTTPHHVTNLGAEPIVGFAVTNLAGGKVIGHVGHYQG